MKKDIETETKIRKKYEKIALRNACINDELHEEITRLKEKEVAKKLEVIKNIENFVTDNDGIISLEVIRKFILD